MVEYDFDDIIKTDKRLREEDAKRFKEEEKNKNAIYIAEQHRADSEKLRKQKIERFSSMKGGLKRDSLDLSKYKSNPSNSRRGLYEYLNSALYQVNKDVSTGKDLIPFFSKEYEFRLDSLPLGLVKDMKIFKKEDPEGFEKYKIALAKRIYRSSKRDVAKGYKINKTMLNFSKRVLQPSLLEKLLSVLTIGSVLASLFFLSNNITGNAILSSVNSETSMFGGIAFFILGLAGFLYLKKK